jgi:D-arabinose 5-phosphate isomerase GutQ
MTETPFVSTEIATQPELWRQVSTRFAQYGGALPKSGQRVAAVGCGTSWFMAMAYAALREDLGHGLTDAFAGSEFPPGREYDVMVVISRSGTTTEVLDLIRNTSLRTIAITATQGSPIVELADETIMLDFADEQSVVQTRFATTTLALLRASLGEDLTQAATDAETALTIKVNELAKLQQVTYVGTRWTVGLAHEAALKQREAASAWTEAYPAMDYRHGPIAIAQPRPPPQPHPLRHPHLSRPRAADETKAKAAIRRALGVPTVGTTRPPTAWPVAAAPTRRLAAVVLTRPCSSFGLYFCLAANMAGSMGPSSRPVTAARTRSTARLDASGQVVIAKPYAATATITVFSGRQRLRRRPTSKAVVMLPTSIAVHT